MSRVLVLEDDPMRHKKFHEVFVNDELVIVDNVDEAIKHLKETDWCALFLDHDLGGDVMVPSGPNTGWGVALWLKEHPDRMPKKVYLHTMNPIGRQNMKQVLPESIEMPFHMLLALFNKET